MKQFIAIPILIGLCLGSTGCATVGTRCLMVDGTYGSPDLYPATQADFSAISCACTEGPVLLLPLWLIDLPFSFVFDTIMLPFDLANQ